MRKSIHPLRKLVAAIIAISFAFTMTVVASPMAASAAEDDGPRIHLIHGIPGVEVDVEANGKDVFTGFSFGDTQDLSALAGETLAGLKVKVAGTDTIAIDVGDMKLPAAGSFTVIAHLDADGKPAVAMFDNDISKIDAGEGRLTVRHAAAAPAVDILADGSAAFSNVTNGKGGTVELDAGTVSASVVPTGETEPVVIGPADLEIVEGTHLIVYAIGSLEDETLDVVTESIADLHSAPAAVHTGNSPVSESASSSPISSNSAALTFGVLATIGLLLAGATASLWTRRQPVQAR